MTAPIDWGERAEAWAAIRRHEDFQQVGVTVSFTRLRKEAYLAGAAAMQQAVLEALAAVYHEEHSIAIVEALMEKRRGPCLR